MLLAALPPDDTAVHDSLEGTWDCIYMENDSGVPLGDARTYSVVIRNQRLTWMKQSAHGPAIPGDVFRCCRDPQSRPMTIDMTHLCRDDSVLVPTLRGIYVLDGDQLTICWGRDRPTAIAKQRNGRPVYVFQRRR
jgi:uncharacterized protein (TIGR03067 family)